MENLIAPLGLKLGSYDSSLHHRNAIKYTPADLVVTMRLESSDRDAIAIVSDNGRGIAEADLPQIFDCLRANRSRHTGGKGLGLTIARAILQANYGRIRVDRQIDRGSTVTFSLPL